MRSYSTGGRDKTAGAIKVKPSFTLDGEVFEGDGHMSIMDLSEFARLANDGMDTGGAEGIAILAEIYRALLGADTYRRFRKFCRENDVDPGLLVQIVGDLVTEESGRPTGRPSDSSDGPPPAPATAKVVSLERGTVREAEQPTEQTEPEPQVLSYG